MRKRKIQHKRRRSHDLLISDWELSTEFSNRKGPGLLKRVVGMKDWVEWAWKRPKQGEERECVSTNKSFEVSGYREVAQQRNSLSLPSWNIAEMHVLLIPCSLYFGVQSCSNFQPDLPASPPIPPCQCAFCSLPPVLLPNATITEPTANPNPSSTMQLPFLIDLIPALIFFFSFSCLTLLSCLLLPLHVFWCLSNEVDFFDITSVTKRMVSFAYPTWPQ